MLDNPLDQKYKKKARKDKMINSLQTSVALVDRPLETCTSSRVFKCFSQETFGSCLRSQEESFLPGTQQRLWLTPCSWTSGWSRWGAILRRFWQGYPGYLGSWAKSVFTESQSKWTKVLREAWVFSNCPHSFWKCHPRMCLSTAIDSSLSVD